MKKIVYLLALTALTFNASAQFKKADNGVQYQIISQTPGRKLAPNDVITFNVVQKNDKDSVLFSTYKQGQPVKTQIRATNNPADLMNIFTLMSVNDSACVKVPVDSIFKGHEEQMPPNFKKGSDVVFNLKILKAQTLEEAMAERNAAMAKIKAEVEKRKVEEAGLLAKYIADNKLSPKTTASGLKYIVREAGAKPKPLNGDTVFVNYTGRTIDGKVFDSSIEADAKAAGLQQPGRSYEPISFALGSHRVIPGWEEGLALLNEGSKAMFLIPSNLGYGDRAMGDDIKPYSTLIFDLELVKVVRVKHAPAAKTSVKKKTSLRKRPTTRKKS
ncbi:FKBP-type peptidyl-prolyl cis-trans isomerase [Mucilaginibacter sp. 21P]|uniref:FKBP-type peptidyl-prolyl cis-trans isomerase n=1 Tax=Mucilaginibacter sp. 21P TaxID=2778902 RepID=UPI001C56A702|nr:FKBP-type peptidyl-prolyl cis-trans isomerase [Mucilaginibacter sp. 21P]QXV66708.1 FKBP-type peptidyl-prolyl cis-trans isomerase [Mucilaginibacter sp. 21P]